MNEKQTHIKNVSEYSAMIIELRTMIDRAVRMATKVRNPKRAVYLVEQLGTHAELVLNVPKMKAEAQKQIERATLRV